MATEAELLKQIEETMTEKFSVIKGENETLLKSQEETLEGLKKQLEEISEKSTNKEAFDAIVKSVEKVSLEIKAFSENAPKNGVTKGDLDKFIERESLKSGFKAQKQGMDSLEVKAAALMTTANIIPNATDGFSPLFGNYIDSTIHNTPKPDNFILPLVNVVTMPGTENVYYTDRINEEGDAQFIGEGVLKPLIDAEWKSSKTEMKEVAERWKMSNRLIMHTSSVVADFRTHANELIESKIDDGVLLGDGVGDNMNGIVTVASPFIVPPALANFYTEANIFDAIIAIATQVRLNNFKGALTCVLNTQYQAIMLGYKNSNGDYIIPPFVTKDGKQVGEVKVVFSNKMDAAKILLGDLKRFTVGISENVMYFEGWENDDFSKNLSSRKLEAFLGSYLPQSYAGAIIYDDIATVLTAIELVPVP